MKIYTLKKYNKFLTHLFEDDTKKMFRAKTFNKQSCYFYNVKQIALDVAIELGAEVIEIEE